MRRVPHSRLLVSSVFETRTLQGELSFANTVEQFDPGNGGRSAIRISEAEHRSSPGFDAAVILFDQNVQVFRRSQRDVLPCLAFSWYLALQDVMQRSHPR